MRKRVVVGGVVVIGIAVVVGLRLTHVLGGQTPSTTYLTATAAVTDIVDTVSVTGSVQPVETYALAFGQAPTRNPAPSTKTSSTGGSVTAAGPTWTVKTVDVKPGETVAAGDVLASADTTDAAAALATAQLNLSAAKAKLDAEFDPGLEQRQGEGEARDHAGEQAALTGADRPVADRGGRAARGVAGAERAR